MQMSICSPKTSNLAVPVNALIIEIEGPGRLTASADSAYQCVRQKAVARRNRPTA